MKFRTLVFFGLSIGTAYAAPVALSTTAATPSTQPADAAQSNDSTEYHVHQLSPDFPITSFKEDHVQLHELGPQEDASTSRIFSRATRNRLLSQAALSSDVEKWDDYAKDMLLLRAQIVDAAKLQAAYPKLDSKKLLSLRSFAQAALKKGTQ